jgi:hypothetical protein
MNVQIFSPYQTVVFMLTQFGRIAELGTQSVGLAPKAMDGLSQKLPIHGQVRALYLYNAGFFPLGLK